MISPPIDILAHLKKKQSNPEPPKTGRPPPPPPPPMRTLSDWPDTTANRIVLGSWSVICMAGLISLVFV